MAQIPDPESTPEGPTYEGRPLVRPDDEIVDQGAGFDIATLLTRRHVLGLVGAGVGAATLAACASSGSDASGSSGSSSSSSDSSGSSSTSSGSTATAEGEIPEETNGPYPADGTDADLNVLEESGIERSDITSSLDDGATAEGVPLDFTFTLTDMANDNAPFEGAVLYIWHCDAQGRYSMYTSGVEDETFLRGIQTADADGAVTFTTIVPGCYAGRWTHMHFEVYPDADSATDVANVIATSQVAFPEDMLNAVYELDAYSGSAENLAGVGGLDSDNIFSDGYDLQMGSFTGDVDSGYIGSLTVGIDTTTEPGAAGGGAPSGGGPGGGGGTDGGGPGGGEPPSGDMPEPPSN